MSNVTIRVFTEQLGDTTASSFVANDGDLFYDKDSTVLRIGDGTTPGGTTLSSGGAGSTETLTDGTETLSLSADTLSYSSTDLQIVNYTNSAINFSQTGVGVTSSGLNDQDDEISATWQFAANGVVILPNETNFNSHSGTVSMGTTDLSGSSLKGSFIEFYETSVDDAWFNATARDNNGHAVSIYGGADANTNLLYARIETYDGGAVYGQYDWTFHQSGKTQFPIIPAPTTSIGVSGDVTGMTAFTQDHMYFCIGQYDGTSDIWKRIAWPGETW